MLYYILNTIIVGNQSRESCVRMSGCKFSKIGVFICEVQKIDIFCTRMTLFHNYLRAKITSGQPYYKLWQKASASFRQYWRMTTAV